MKYRTPEIQFHHTPTKESVVSEAGRVDKAKLVLLKH